MPVSTPPCETPLPPATKQKSNRIIGLLGPAFVAAVAYVDPGNVAANITAGSTYGYLLTWVLVAASAMAVLIQYQSAKLGIVTGKSIPEYLGDTLRPTARRLYWLQAEIVAGATDLAEVIGGAIALHLLFDLPLVWGGVIVGAASMLFLVLKDRRGQKIFENAVIVFLTIIAVGFLSGLFVSPPAAHDVARGLIPNFQGQESVLVAASMLGATVMPHAIYLHSSLVGDRYGNEHSESRIRRLLHASKVDVVGALALAGVVNIGLLLLAASALRGADGTDTIEGAHAAVSSTFGTGIGFLFALGLLASSLASTSVGAYAGSEIMRGLLKFQVPLYVRRIVTIIPAIIILAMGAEPTWALVISQVVLSFGIPMAIIPLTLLTRSEKVMGKWRDGGVIGSLMVVVSLLIVALNLWLVVLTLQ
ncbi:manganese transport protein [Arcanobacterium pluranimalium]|uniref:Nramp family divalent metal transporter n=1 Tax=Arcanobacterium pluranimalium TaxID=108028 RepID=UPI00195E1CE0|nr:Nramp family divalent metal transporter [Arcanobacterium pluranimalium]MBM7824319.1 manganese transport protein [Arcanobacterium pluranimalium]